MNTTRTIEITAQSEEAALDTVEGELQAGESILSSELISAPVKGMFGTVGKAEYKMRFSIGRKEVAETTEVADKEEDLVERKDNSRRPERKERKEREGRKDRPRAQRQRHDNSQSDDQEPTPDRKKEDVSESVKNHPEYAKIYELINDVSSNVGIDEVELIEYQRDGAWVIEASGENVSQLIGKRGKTLDSLQYLLNIVLNKGREDRVKLVIDAQGYREKRYKNLMMLASRMCRKAISTRRPIELEPMSTLDRRTIHMALKDRSDIESYSKGTEPMRRVVVAPIKTKKKEHTNSGWQPAAPVNDYVEVEHDEDVPTSVPMFMEDDV